MGELRLVGGTRVTTDQLCSVADCTICVPTSQCSCPSEGSEARGAERMKLVSANTLQSRAIEILGLDSSALDLSSPEAIASTIRRAASFACPCSRGHLTTRCYELLAPLLGPQFPRETVADALEALISYVDLF